jgi:hypothetical protein
MGPPVKPGWLGRGRVWRSDRLQPRRSRFELRLGRGRRHRCADGARGFPGGLEIGGANDTKIGTIERVMIDKLSGRVSCAVLSFGGFLGTGDDHYPLPWQSLKYDTNLGGYRTGITETQLKGAPKYSNDSAWNWSDPARTRAVKEYYGVATP